LQEFVQTAGIIAMGVDGPTVYGRGVANWDDVRRIALSLPEAHEDLRRGLMFWVVRDKLFVWERPLRQSDLKALGEAAPDGPILGARVEHLVAKEALIADDPNVYFTTPHFDGYPAVLVQLEKIAPDELEELIVEAWLARAPKRLAREYVEERFGPDE
jgi:hypothetical protein